MPDRADPVTAAVPVPRRTPKPSAKARRSAARLAAVQALYALAQTRAEVDGVIADFVNRRFGEEVDGDVYVAPEPGFFGDIVRGVVSRHSEIEGLLEANLVRPWTLDRLELLLRLILRCGIYETLAHPETPVAIIIADYINIADAFFAGKEPSIVHAVLDRVAKAVRPSGAG